MKKNLIKLADYHLPGGYDSTTGWHPGVEKLWKEYVKEHNKEIKELYEEGELSYEEMEDELKDEKEIPEISGVSYNKLEILLDIDNKKLVFRGQVGLGFFNSEEVEGDFEYEYPLEDLNLEKVRKELGAEKDDEFISFFLDVDIDEYAVDNKEDLITWRDIEEKIDKAVSKTLNKKKRLI